MADLDRELEIEKRCMILARMNREKFDFFYLKYYGRIFSYVQKCVLDIDTTKDLVNDTFLLAMDRLHSFRWQGVTFGAWLYRIALNVVRGYLRREKLRMKHLVDYDTDLVPSGRNPLSDLLVTENQKHIYEQLDRLDEISRTIIVLHHFEGLKTREVAAVMDMKESTVKSRLARNRRLMEKRLIARGITFQNR